MLSIQEYGRVAEIEKHQASGLGIIPAILGAVAALAPLATGLLNKGGGGSNEQQAVMAAQMEMQRRADEAARQRSTRNLWLGAGAVGLGLVLIALVAKRKSRSGRRR